jgi:hypothetical protein
MEEREGKEASGGSFAEKARVRLALFSSAKGGTRFKAGVKQWPSGSKHCASVFRSYYSRGRDIEADEVANAVLYLLRMTQPSVSGIEILVDGGATGAPPGAPIYRSP